MVAISQSIVFNLRRAGFSLRPREGTEDPEWHLVTNEGLDTGFIIRDWVAAGLGYALFRNTELIAEGLEFRQALGRAIALQRADSRPVE